MPATQHRLSFSRRQFVQGVGTAGLGLLAGCGRLPGQARPSRPYHIGFLAPGPRAGRDLHGLRQSLAELGYLEGQHMVFEQPNAAGLDARLPELASQLVRVPVDIIVAQTTPAIRAAKAATRTIPIIMLVAGDPVRNGLIASLAQPGANVTGVTTDIAGQLHGKRLELLKELVPGLTRVLTITLTGSESAQIALSDAQAAAQALALDLLASPVQSREDVRAALEAAKHYGVQALLTLPAPLPEGGAALVVALAAQNRLPATYAFREQVDNGGLMYYGADYVVLARRAAYYVDRILKGTKPADLPVEQPREFEFVVNLRTAETLGLTIPPHVLLLATEVIR
jgi:putative ABC transport system substrate-binding protein